MKEEPRKPLRVRSVGTKLTEAEYAQCERLAARRGLTLSEWCREALLEAPESPARNREPEVILSEILALRKILINLFYGQAAGERLSEDRMQELVESADSDKLRKAAERLQAVPTVRSGGASDGDHSESVPGVCGE